MYFHKIHDKQFCNAGKFKLILDIGRMYEAD